MTGGGEGVGGEEGEDAAMGREHLTSSLQEKGREGGREEGMSNMHYSM